MSSTTSVLFGAEITVDDDGADISDADFDNIQAAVDAASDGDTILVYPGTYVAADEDDAQVVDLLGKAITLRSNAGPEETFIDGQGERRGIVCMTSEPETTIIDGFTILNGHISGGGAQDTTPYRGGGMYIKEASPSVANCIFRENDAYTAGGGMAIVRDDWSDSSRTFSPDVSNCLFEANTADGNGKGLFIFGCEPVISQTTFQDHGTVATEQGAGLYAANSKARLTECVFTNNIGWEGGGAFFARVYSCCNPDPFNGGCIELPRQECLDLGYDYFGEESAPTLIKCVFRDNQANFGGGVFFDGGSPEVRECIFENNIASSEGGGLYITQVEFARRGSLIQLTYIGENSAGIGGGIACYSSGSGDPENPASPVFDRCVFKKNRAVTETNGGVGGGVYLLGNGLGWETGGGEPNFRGCSFIENVTNGIGGGAFVDNNSNSDTRPTWSHCLFACNEAKLSGGGAFIGENAIGATFAQCIFHDNESLEKSGGGLCFDLQPYELPDANPYGKSYICNSQFQFNKALAEGSCSGCDSGASNSPGYGCGGGLWLTTRAWCQDPMVKYTDNSFWFNDADAECTKDVRFPTRAVSCPTESNPGCGQLDLSCGNDAPQIWTVTTSHTLVPEADLPCDQLNPLRRLFESNESACIADLNDDGIVDGADLTIMLSAWGTVCENNDPYPTTCGNPEEEQARPFSETLHGDACCAGDMTINQDWLSVANGTYTSCGGADLNNDGVVDGQDLSILLGNWGLCL